MTQNSGPSDTEMDGSPDPSATQAGWYPTPQGDLRYWDRSRWLDIPAPQGSILEAASNVPPAPVGDVPVSHSGDAPGGDSKGDSVAPTLVEPVKKSSLKKWLPLTLVGVLAIGVGTGVAVLNKPVRSIESAYKTCVEEHGIDSGITLGNGLAGQTIAVIEPRWEREVKDCVYAELGAPQAIIDQQELAVYAGHENVEDSSKLETFTFGDFAITWAWMPDLSNLALFFYEVDTEDPTSGGIPTAAGQALIDYLSATTDSAELPQECSDLTGRPNPASNELIAAADCKIPSNKISSVDYLELAIIACSPTDYLLRDQYIRTPTQLTGLSFSGLRVEGTQVFETLTKPFSSHPLVQGSETLLELVDQPSKGIPLQVVEITRAIGGVSFESPSYLQIDCIEDGRSFNFSEWQLQQAPIGGGDPVGEPELELEPEFDDLGSYEDEYQDEIIQPGEPGCNAGASACGFENGIDFQEVERVIREDLLGFYGHDVGEVTCTSEIYPPNRTPVGELLRCDLSDPPLEEEYISILVIDTEPYFVMTGFH